MTELSKLMQQGLPEGGVLLPERKTHMEVLDESSGNVWMSVDSISQQQFDTFELPSGWRKIGLGAGAMDQALFRHSPNASDQPVRDQIINGLRFINVALPQLDATQQLACGLFKIMVNKAHVLGFEAGRQVSILRMNNQHYVEVVGDKSSDTELSLQGGAKISQIVLNKPWVVELPTPTQTLWVFQPTLRSFQGPVELPPTH